MSAWCVVVIGLPTEAAAELVRERALTEASHAGFSRLTAVVQPAANVFVVPPEPSSTIEGAVLQATETEEEPP